MQIEVALEAAKADPTHSARASNGDTVKRLFDLTASAALLILLSPFLICISIAIKLDSRGPVLYRCRRIGRHGSEFAMLKFRKMRDGALGPPLTIGGDERFTRLGRLLVATRFDEIPQLWNVLRGEMSLVGPRPEDPEIVSLNLDHYAVILGVRPGITGLCQLAFAKEGEILDPDDRLRDYVERLLPEKMSIDGLYAGSRSLSMDLRILAWTVTAVAFRRDVAVHRGSGRLSLRQPRQALARVDERSVIQRLERPCS